MTDARRIADLEATLGAMRQSRNDSAAAIAALAARLARSHAALRVAAADYTEMRHQKEALERKLSELHHRIRTGTACQFGAAHDKGKACNCYATTPEGRKTRAATWAIIDELLAERNGCVPSIWVRWRCMKQNVAPIPEGPLIERWIDERRRRYAVAATRVILTNDNDVDIDDDTVRGASALLALGGGGE